ncbi:hypothetical protein [Campylobacter hyointestinalis]|uniref:hypothetical protein n=1 Tax=Campylobacter hyointestinalis TaxID=198 RepID=UPI000CE4DA4C|nr:hypothetical protein [Campylobacter hyointestinalis]PPB68445.1 hypothetical protein CDQ76_04810 [Campylobacter hyointestinalis subsp. hyointestinalis]
MLSINIQTKANRNTIDAIKELLLSIDPTAIIVYDEPSSLSRADEQRLQEIYDKSQKGELKYYSDDEVSQRLKGKGYQW